MEGELFEGALIERPPVRAWLDTWNRHLDKKRLPHLSERGCAALGKQLTKLWELRAKATDLISTMIETWFERLDGWPLETGFAPEAFLRWVPKALVQMDQVETKRASEAARRSREAQRLKALTEFEGTPASMETVKKVKAALFGRKEVRQ